MQEKSDRTSGFWKCDRFFYKVGGRERGVGGRLVGVKDNLTQSPITNHPSPITNFHRS
jgi:hypothetical protein